MFRSLGAKANNLNENVKLFFGDSHLQLSYQNRGMLKLFISNLKLQMQRQLKQNLDVSEAFFLIGFAETKLLEFVESRQNKLPTNFQEAELFKQMDAVDFQKAFLENPQLVFLGRKNRSIEKTEDAFIEKISNLLNEASIAKLEPLELLELYSNKIETLKSELSWELKKQSKGLHFLSPKETKDILANSFNEPVLYYKNKAKATQWSIEGFRFVQDAEGRRL